jgi:hypothetical protein
VTLFRRGKSTPLKDTHASCCTQDEHMSSDTHEWVRDLLPNQNQGNGDIIRTKLSGKDPKTHMAILGIHLLRLCCEGTQN